MARGFSKAIITGNITRDPELRTTPSGSQVCSFSVAVNRTFKDSSGTSQETVSFFDCSAWGRSAEIINQYAKKGTGILVSGRLEQRSWEDKNTGQKRSRVEIVVEEFSFLSGNDRSAGSTSAGSSIETQDSQDIIPDDIPEDGDINLDEVPF